MHLGSKINKGQVLDPLKKGIKSLSFICLALCSFLPASFAANIEAVLDSNNGSSAFVVQDSGTATMASIDSDGKAWFASNVGIGTSVPRTLLEVDGFLYATQIGIGTTVATSLLNFPVGTTAASGILFGSDVNLYRSQANRLRTDDAIDADGGIYSTTGTFSGIVTATSFVGNGANLTNISTSAVNPAGNNNNVQYKDSVGALAGSDAFVFNGTNVGIGTSVPRTMLEVDGTVYAANIGIGSTAPAAALDIQAGTIRLGGTTMSSDSGNLKFDNWNSIWVADVRGTNYDLAKVDATSVLRVDTTNSRIGIGTTVPAARVDVGGGTVTNIDGVDDLLVKGDIEADGNIYGVSGAFTGTITANAFSGDGSGLTGVAAAGGWTDGTNVVYTTAGADNVGIGTSAPTQLLQLNATNPILRISGSGSPELNLDQGTEYSGFQFRRSDEWGPLGWENKSVEDIALLFGTNNQLRMIIDNTGNVGIGVTNPTSLLDVAGQLRVNTRASGEQDALYFKAGPGGGGSTMSIAGDTTGVDLGQNIGGRISFVDDGAYGAHLVFENRTGSQGMTTTEKMRITTGGNVGIGTAVPSSMLDIGGGTRTHIDGVDDLLVKGDIEADGDIYGAAGNFTGTVTANAFVGNGSGLTGVAAAGGWTDGTNVVTTTVGADNVGIGTAAPAAKLDLVGAGTTSATAALMIRNADRTARVAVLDNGNVGIGTTVPAKALAVVGGGSFSSDVSIGGVGNSAGLVIGENANIHPANGNITIDSWGGSYGVYLKGGTGVFLQSPSGTERMRVNNAGNVGIGTTAPVAKLDLVGAGTTSATAALIIRDSTKAAKVTFLDNGNVGIGTASPAYHLDVNGFAHVNTGLSIGTEAGPHVQLGNHKVQIVAEGTQSPLTIIGGSGVVEMWDALPLTAASSFGHAVPGSAVGANFIFSRFVLGEGWYETMRIQNATGNVGIGSTAPTQKLDVAGTVKATAFSGDGSGLTGIAAAGGWTDGANVVYTTTGTDSVGIGTTAPLAKLDMVGLGSTSATSAVIIRNSLNVPKVAVLDNGNVGIGTYVPTLALDVVGAGRFTTGISIGSASYIGNTSAAANGRIYVKTTGAFIDRNTADANPALTVQQLHASSTGPILQLQNDSATKFVVAQNGNVGIGSASPAYRLDVQGATGNPIVASFSSDNPTAYADVLIRNNGVFGDDNNQAGVRLTVSGDGTEFGEPYAGVKFGKTSNASSYGGFAYFWNFENTPFVFATHNAERMRITADGNVGIGDVDPGAALVVGDDTARALANGAGDVYVQNDMEIGGVARFLGAVDQGPLGIDRIDAGVQGGTPRMIFEDAETSSSWQIDNDGGTFRWFTPGVVHMLLYSTGKAWIENNLGIADPDFDARATLVVGDDTGMDQVDGSLDLYVQDAIEADGDIYAVGGNFSGTVAASAFSGDGSGLTGLAAAGGWTDGTNVVTTTVAADNVGIGTAAPAAKLDLVGAGTTSATSALIVRASDKTARITVLDDGNVGIGTTAPVLRLDVNGVIASGRNAGGSGEIRSYQGAGNYVSLKTQVPKSGLFRNNTDFFAYYDTVNGNTVLDATFAGSSVLFNVQGAEKMRIANSGNVGIGTSVPNGKVVIAGSSLAYTSGGPAGVNVGILRLATGTGAETDESLTFGVHDGDYSWIQAVKAAAGYRNLLINQNGGNVGIGSVAPSQRLDVVGTVKATAFVGDGSGLTGITAAGGWTDGTNVVYTTAGTDSVGIGTSSPSVDPMATNLDVYNLNTHAVAEVTTGSTAHTGNFLLRNSAGDKTWAQTIRSSNESYRYGIYHHNGSSWSTELFSILPVGNVGIGTNNPGAKLDIGGGTATNIDGADDLLVKGDIEADGNIYGTAATFTGTVTANAFSGNGSGLTGLPAGGAAGTTTQVQYNDAGFMAGAPGLVYEKATGSVGIGTAAPTSFLTIYHPTDPRIEIRSDAGYMYISKVSGSWSGTTNPFIFQASGGDLVYTTALNDPTKGLVIKDGGNVGFGYADPGTAKVAVNGNLGIGTTAPNALLDVAGDSIISGRLIVGENPASTPDISIYRTDRAGQAVYFAVENADNTDGASNGRFDVRVGGDNGGDPYVNLDISNVGGWSVGIDNSDNDTFKIDRGAPPSPGVDTKLAIQTDGNVGIGVDAPTEKLDVAGTVKATAFSGDGSALTGIVGAVSGLNAGRVPYAQDADTLVDSSIYVSGTNVGIGSSSPASLLDVYAGGASRLTVAANGYVTAGSRFIASLGVFPSLVSADAGRSISLPNGDNDIVFNTTAATKGYLFNVASNTKVAISNDGNVGIGSAAPGATLDVNGASIFRGSITTTGTNGILVGGSGGLARSASYLLVNQTGLANSGVRFYADNLERMTILHGNGNVGIGTTVPAAKLDIGGGTVSNIDGADDLLVKGDIEADGNIYGTAGTFTGTVTANAFSGDGSALTGIVGAVSGLGAGYIPRAQDADTLVDSVIYSDGTNVGIGSTLPQARLQVASGQAYTANAEIARFSYDTTSSRYVRVRQSGTNSIVESVSSSMTVGTGGGDTLSLQTNGTAKMTVLSGGNVGIGTTAPNSRLQIGGSVAVYRTATAVSANSAGETIIGVTNTDTERTITLDTDDVKAGRVVIVKDESGNAGTHNITVATEGAETIDGADSIDITVNYGVLRVYSDGTNWFTF